MKSKKQDIENLLKKVEKVSKENKLDLSSGEDLSIGIMNLIAIEEHLFYTSQKTGKKKYLELLNEIRSMRTDLMKEIVTDYEGEVWCISKHLLAASMRVMEVGTKELKKAVGAEPAEAEKHKDKAWNLFEKSYNLYSLFWGINLNVVRVDQVAQVENEKNKVKFIDEKGKEKDSQSVLSKLGVLVKKAIDCCKE